MCHAELVSRLSQLTIDPSDRLQHHLTKPTQRYAHLSQETLLAAVDAAADATGMNWSQPQKNKAA